MSGPLSGLTVVDLSRILAGPWSTQVLADYGATVWKVEKPQVGDDTRHWGPPYYQSVQGDYQSSAYFSCANRGKKSVAIDISTESGQQTVKELIGKADILVENYRVGALAKYGLDYQNMKSINPSIIYCSITGFGQNGPRKKQAGYDAMIQAQSGLMSITGEPDGQPQKVGVAVSDIMTGMYAVSAILAAVIHRQRSGEGQHIDLALFDVQLAALANQVSNYLCTGNTPQRMGNAHPNICPYESFDTSDGYLFLAVGNDGQFQRCCEVLELPELACDPRFSTNALRVEHRKILVHILKSAFALNTTENWLKGLEKVGVPCGPINTVEQGLADPQAKARNMVIECQHESGMSIPTVANPVKFSHTPVSVGSAPPMLGQDQLELELWLSQNKD